MTLKRWQEQGLQLHLALNLSAKQLQDSDIVETFERNIILTGCDPSLLQVELTESILMTDVKLALDTLTRLQTLGIKIAIDDFGTGYSSLAYLHTFPIHILKVDRSFVKDLPFCADSIFCLIIVRITRHVQNQLNNEKNHSQVNQPRLLLDLHQP